MCKRFVRIYEYVVRNYLKWQKYGKKLIQNVADFVTKNVRHVMATKRQQKREGYVADN